MDGEGTKRADFSTVSAGTRAQLKLATSL